MTGVVPMSLREQKLLFWDKWVLCLLLLRKAVGFGGGISIGSRVTAVGPF